MQACRQKKAAPFCSPGFRKSRKSAISAASFLLSPNKAFGFAGDPRRYACRFVSGSIANSAFSVLRIGVTGRDMQA